MASSLPDSSAVADYYNNDRIAAFYQLCWGGSDIHIGLYTHGTESVAAASAAMTKHLIDLAGISDGDRVLDIACGFGGTLRLLATMGCRARGIDISKACVERARAANVAAGLDDVIDVSEGDFHDIASPDGDWDAVVCQEAIIHSADRPRVFAEVYRVLRPGGVFASSDILTAEDADIAVVAVAFERLGADPGATARDYRDMARAAGFDVEHVDERAQDIQTHYDKLAENLAAVAADIDHENVNAIARSLSRWQVALAGGHITWACFVARKPASETIEL